MFFTSKLHFINFVMVFSSPSFIFFNFLVCVLNQRINYFCGTHSASYWISNPVEIYNGETNILYFLFSLEWMTKSLYLGPCLIALYRLCKIIISISEIMTSLSGPLKIAHERHKPHRLYYSPLFHFSGNFFFLSCFIVQDRK